ncbi:hypothetical protein Tco_0747996 [Tanacetum coccineum]|uniref:TPX2 C-terminal domain-containing protein n=1 Tax=Tanacetum coccineum TaxID=301880 RepID=A0ABQ4YV95_9ASTR
MLPCNIEKPETTELRRLRQSFCFKARPLPKFYNERERPKSPLKKVTNAINKKHMATSSKVFFVDYVVVTSLYDFAYVNLALQAANGVIKTSETPSVKRRMEIPVHPLAAGSKTPGQKWQIFSAVSKSLRAYKNKLQSPTIPSPFTFRTEERAARRKQARAHIWFFDLGLLLKKSYFLTSANNIEGESSDRIEKNKTKLLL